MQTRAENNLPEAVDLTLTEVQPDAGRPDLVLWPTLAVGGLTAVSAALAAAVVSPRVSRGVAISAWVAAAVIGASATVSAAVAASVTAAHGNSPNGSRSRPKRASAPR